MKKPIQNIILLVLLCLGSVSTHAVEDNESVTLILSDSKKLPKIHISIQQPPGWRTEWYDSGTQSIIRLYRVKANGSEAIVVTASPISQKFIGKSTDEIFGDEFYQEFSKHVKLSARRQLKEANWDGIYIEYPVPTSLNKGSYTINVKNWMMVSDDHVVQFQCYFIRNPNLSTEEQAESDRTLNAAYTNILKTVRKIE